MDPTLAINLSKDDMILNFTKISQDCYAQDRNIIQYLKDHKIDLTCHLTDGDLDTIEMAYREVLRIPPDVPYFKDASHAPAVQERGSSEEIIPNTTLPTGPNPTNAAASSSSKDTTANTPTKKPRGRPPGVPNRDKNAPPPVKIPKKRGRPKNSKNKPKDPNAPPKVRKPKNARSASGSPVTKQYTPAQEAQLLTAAQTPTPIRQAPASNIPATNQQDPAANNVPYDDQITALQTYEQDPAATHTLYADQITALPLYQQDPAATDILNADQITALQTFNDNHPAVDIPIDPQLTTMGSLPAPTQQAPMPQYQPAPAQAPLFSTPAPAPMLMPTPMPAYPPSSMPLPPLALASHCLYPSLPKTPTTMEMQHYQPAPIPENLPIPAQTPQYHYPNPLQTTMPTLPYRPAPAQIEPLPTAEQLETDLPMEDVKWDDFVDFDAVRTEEGEKEDSAAVEQGCMTYHEFEKEEWRLLGATLGQNLVEM